MGAIASQITSLTIVFSTVYSDADVRKHQSSASLASVRGIHRGPVNSPHKWPVTRKCFHLMTSSWIALNDGNKELSEFYTQVYPIEQYQKLTYLGQVKMAAILQTTFSNSSTNCLNCYWNLTEFTSKGPINSGRVLVEKKDMATSHHLNQCWHIFLTHICVTRPPR